MLTWLYKILFYLPVKIWVNSSSIPLDPISNLSVDPGKPVLYIFKTNSIIDLLAFHFLSKKIALPSPFKQIKVNNISIPRYIYIYKTPLLFSTTAQKRLTEYKIFQKWIDLHEKVPYLDIQIITIPTFWTRNPGLRKSNHQSSNITLTSSLQNLLLMIFHGREHTSMLTSMVKLSDLLKHRTQNSRKLKDQAYLLERMVRMFFFRSERISKGPNLPIREELINELLHHTNIQKAIEYEAENQNTTLPSETKHAQKIMKEMFANISFGLIHFLNNIAKIVWNHLYKGINVTGDENVRNLVQNGHEIIYIPCHRSHMDYLLLAFVIYNAGLTPPHVASGINLNFWPFGSIIRRCGAFFLRRSFNGDKLYTTIFREYVSYLCSHGFSLEFFIEGKRSRTGRLLNPKTGMLSMMVQTMLRGISKPVSIVPVYISYEHVMEVNTYTKELLGKKKETENIWQIFGIFKKLKNYGHSYVNFGEPISITKFLNNYQNDWHESIDPSGNFKPQWLYRCVSDLAHKVMLNLCDAIAVNGLTLSALVILACEKYTLPVEDLRDCIDKLNTLLKQITISNYTQFSHDTSEQLLKDAIELRKFDIVKIYGVPSVVLVRKQYSQLTYYRNNIIPLFIIPSLILKMITLSDKIVKDELIRCLHILYGIMQHELFIPITENELDNYTKRILHSFVSLELVNEIDGCYRIKAKNAHLSKILSNICSETLIRYTVFFTIISSENIIKYENLERNWVCILKRIPVHMKISKAPEFSDPEIVKSMVSYLEKNNMAKEINVDGVLKFDLELLEETISLVMSLTSDELHGKIVKNLDSINSSL